MYVEVSRTGGFAGITRTWSVEVEQTPDPLSWVILVDACPWDEPDPAPTGTDRFIYLVRADERKATLPEPAVSGPWRELVDRVRRFSGTHGRGPETPVDADPPSSPALPPATDAGSVSPETAPPETAPPETAPPETVSGSGAAPQDCPAPSSGTPAPSSGTPAAADGTPTVGPAPSTPAQTPDASPG